MANVGKYVDRSPDIRSAGFLRRSTETAEDALKEYHVEEVAEAIVKTKCKSAGSAGRNLYPQSPFMPTDGMKDIFSTELKKSRFVEFREKFWEDMFFKKPELGKVFQLHAKPDNITNENTIFGAETNRSEPCYELVLPKKQLIDINREYMKWHDKYILSHNHYFPSERICRHYDLKNFNPANTFGVRSNADITGGNVRKCLTRCERMIVIKKAQKDFLDMSIGQLGKRSKRYEGIVPPDALLGLYLPRDDCDAKALIENINPCVKKTKLIESIAHINRLRRKLFSRMNFHIHDFKAALENLDGKKTGYLPLLTVFEAAYSLRIHMDPDKIRTAAKLFELFVDNDLKTECIDYEKFLKILQIQYPLPKTGNISTMPDNVYNKETTYRELCKDMNKKPFEAKVPITKISKPEETTGKDLISPSIPLQFGLAQSDFNELRPKEELCRIFKRIITDPNLFEKIWQQAKMQLNPVNNCISVNQLRLIMNTIQ